MHANDFFLSIEGKLPLEGFLLIKILNKLNLTYSNLDNLNLS